MNFKKFGKYTIIKKITSGGMADILLATELSPTGFGRFVVIKRALSKFSDNEEFKDMFKNEGKVASNLKHKNITTIHEFGIEKNQFFLAMEYISGKNLREFVKKLQARSMKLIIPNILYVIKEVAAGLNYAHNAIDANTGQPLNIIHRDVSPQNIMLTFDGQVKLIDFGIAKIADTNLTRAGHLKGKFSYMSPEQANGQELDGRADIFCLGIIFWELLSGKRLFASSNELVSLKKVRNCDIPDIKKINPNISSNLKNILNKTLSKNKNSRYRTAARLEQDLNLFLNKNYPEFSHYDFIALMKETYRKDIMSEREDLKIYSNEFKKYTNALNIESSFQNKVLLDVPDITSLNSNIADTKSPVTESLLEENKPSILSHPSSFFETTVENTTLNQAEKEITEKNTTLIQKQDSKIDLTETKKKLKSQKVTINTEKTQHTQSPSNNADLKLKISDSDLKIEKTNSKTDLYQSKLTKSLLSQNSKKWDIEEIKMDISSTKKIVIPALLIISGFALASFWILRNQNKPAETPQPIASSPATTSETQTQRTPTYADQNIKKVFVKSNPSNANIYINNKITSKYTPSLLNLRLDNTVFITIKKSGFLPKTIAINSTNFQSRISINLVKDRSANKIKTHIIQ